MFNIAVLGAGMQAQGVAYYLSHDERVSRFVCFDNNSDNLLKIKKYLGNKGGTIYLDVTDDRKLLIALQGGGFHGVINTLPYELLPQTTQTTIIAGLPGVDLGQATEEQEYLRETAEVMNVSHARGCGIAPGFISDIGFDGMRKLDVCHQIRMYCGGILQNPRGKLGHASPFSVPGLEYEYTDKPCMIWEGKKTKGFPLMPDVEQIFVLQNGGKIINTEAAATGKVFENDLELWGNTKTVTYATLRHAGFGHFAKVRVAFAKLKTREERINWLWRNLIPIERENDMMVWRVYIVGEKNGIKTTIIYESICLHNEEISLSAMQQYTAFPASETLLQMVSNPQRWPKGFPYHERHLNVKLAKRNMYKHGLVVKKTVTPDFS